MPIVVRLTFRRMDAIDRAHFHTRAIFDVDTGFYYDIGNFNLSSFP